MQSEMGSEELAFERANGLCAAGVLTAVRRVGLPPLGGDAELELDFLSPEGPKTFCIMVGAIGASDVRIRQGRALDLDYAHLREEYPEEFATLVGDWSQRDEVLAAWAIGSSLSDPCRLRMTNPYSEIVGFSFLCTRGGEVFGRLALIGEADYLYAASLDAAELAGYGLRAI